MILLAQVRQQMPAHLMKLIHRVPSLPLHALIRFLRQASARCMPTIINAKHAQKKQPKNWIALQVCLTPVYYQTQPYRMVPLRRLRSLQRCCVKHKLITTAQVIFFLVFHRAAKKATLVLKIAAKVRLAQSLMQHSWVSHLMLRVAQQNM